MKKECEPKEKNPCAVCLLHSGIVVTQKHHKDWLKAISRKVNAIIMLALANLVLLVIILVTKTL